VCLSTVINANGDSEGRSRSLASFQPAHSPCSHPSRARGYAVSRWNGLRWFLAPGFLAAHQGSSTVALSRPSWFCGQVVTLVLWNTRLLPPLGRQRTVAVGGSECFCGQRMFWQGNANISFHGLPTPQITDISLAGAGSVVCCFLLFALRNPRCRSMVPFLRVQRWLKMRGACSLNGVFNNGLW